MKLYGISEIAAALGQPPDKVSVWKSRGKLPAPDVVLQMGPVWTAKTIGPWIRKTLRQREVT